MYDFEALRRKVKKDGVDKTLADIMSPSLSKVDRDSLTKIHALIDGFPNLTLLYTLALA